jgi:hypothetical protein
VSLFFTVIFLVKLDTLIFKLDGIPERIIEGLLEPLAKSLREFLHLLVLASRYLVQSHYSACTFTTLTLAYLLLGLSFVLVGLREIKLGVKS